LKTLIFIGLLISGSIFAQSKVELEQKRSKTQKEIELTNSLLKSIRVDAKNSMSKLNLVQRKISLQNDLLDDLEKEVSAIQLEIEGLNQNLFVLSDELVTIKNEYAKLIYYYYYYKHFDNQTMFLLSSESFAQFYHRLKYLQQLAEYRKKQADKIVMLSNEITVKANEAKKVVDQKKTVLAIQEHEKNELEVSKRNQESLIKDLKTREKQLKEKLKNQQTIAAQLKKAIQNIIEEEARKAIAASAKVNNKESIKSAPKSMYDRLTPEDKLISNQFDKNKGKLPWPTRKGIITGYFGKHEHPVLKKVYVENNGIDISTIKGENVRSIANGVVSKVFSIKGANNTIIIRHGSFLTVYQNVVNVQVSSGQKVDSKQIIGEVYYSEDDNQSLLHFEIWNELSKLNPVEWLLKQNS